MEIQTKPKLYNPLIVQLQTLEVKDKTVENYFAQIKDNFYCSVKAHYLIARDLFDAKENLKSNDFARLVKQLGFSGATQSKYFSIGKDVRLFQLFISGKLPMKWTSQYILTQLTDAQFNKVAKKIDADTSAKEIKKIAGVSGKQNNKIAHDLLSFLQLQVDKTKVDVSTYDKLVDKVKSALTKMPEIKIIDDKVDTVKEKISNFCIRQQRLMADVRKAKSILKNASAYSA